MIVRVCPVCVTSLHGRDPRTVTCSPACRREHARVMRLYRGEPDGPYRTVAEYEARRRRVRANVASEA